MTLNTNWGGSGYTLDDIDLPGWIVNTQTRGSLDYFQIERAPSGSHTHSQYPRDPQGLNNQYTAPYRFIVFNPKRSGGEAPRRMSSKRSATTER